MTRMFIVFRRVWVPIWLFVIVLVLVACTSVDIEPGAIALDEATTNDSTAAQSYPGPEQLFLEEQSQSAYPGPLAVTTPVSLPTPFPTFVPPPICDIRPPIEVAMSSEETLPDYPRFTEPGIVTTNAIGFSIAEWLPDSQRLLVSQGDGAFGTISVLDITTGAAVEYAQRRDLSSSAPVWLDEKQGVMFVDATAAGWDLRFSDGTDTIILTQQLASTFIAKSLDPEHVAITFSGEPGALMAIDTDAQTRQLTTVELNKTTRQIPLSSTDAYRLAWSPDSNWIAQYRGENLYLINVKAQTICQMDLGDYGETGSGHVFYAHWSPNSRYLGLAIKRQKAIPELNVLNIETGELHILSLPLDTTSWPPESIGSAVWSPDSEKILVQVTSRNSEMTKTDAEWLLVDISSRKFIYPLPNYTFAPGVGNVVWSPDGSKVAFSCPTHGKGNICIMEVEWPQ